MRKNKKASIDTGIISQNDAIFKCPICLQQMKILNTNSLKCSNDHCFDVSKHGYVNMLSHSVKNKYNKQMFKSRRILSKSGFFEPLNEQISQRIINQAAFKSEEWKVLDASKMPI